MDPILSHDDKVKIGELIIDRFKKTGFQSQARFAKSIGLDPADISNLKNQKWMFNASLIGFYKWIKMARIVGLVNDASEEWFTADTYVKQFIDKQLNYCKDYSMTNIMVDEAGIGKTHTCKEFARNHSNVYYIDCSNCRTKNRFILAIANVVGADVNGKFDELFEDVIFILQRSQKPLLIFDEAGDLEDKALLEFKRLYNALEDICGFYVVGSDGLRAKIEKGIKNRKVGYKEIFSRFGKKYSRATDQDREGYVAELREMAEKVLDANGITNKAIKDNIIKSLAINGIKDLRTVRREVRKLKIEAMTTQE